MGYGAYPLGEGVCVCMCRTTVGRCLPTPNRTAPQQGVVWVCCRVLWKWLISLLTHVLLLHVLCLATLVAPACLQSDGRQFVSANVPVSLDHTKAYYEARGLTPGNPYYISAVGK